MSTTFSNRYPFGIASLVAHNKRSAGSSRYSAMISYRLVSIAAALFVLAVAAPKLFLAAESPLSIVEAGVEQSEDAPFVPRDYRFLPGDYLYFSFQVGGFGIRSEDRDEVHKIALTYEVTAENVSGVPLTPPSSGAVRTELSPEDKHWMPKRRVSFLIPSFVAAGEFRIHVHVKDLVANTEFSQNFPFRIGGIEIQPASSLTVQNFRFLRNENDREELRVPAYSPGDSVYATFDMTGFKTDSQNQYHVSYGLSVLEPDGKPFIQEPKAAELEAASFYPAQYLPGVLNLKTSSGVSRGEYVVVLTIHDLFANTTYQMKRAFSIE